MPSPRLIIDGSTSRKLIALYGYQVLGDKAFLSKRPDSDGMWKWEYDRRFLLRPAEPQVNTHQSNVLLRPLGGGIIERNSG